MRRPLLVKNRRFTRPSGRRSGNSPGCTFFVNLPKVAFGDEQHVDEDLSEHDLSGVTFVQCIFSRCSLRATKLIEASLRGCTLIECDLRGANLSSCVFDSTALLQCQFGFSSLMGTQFRGCK